MKKPLTARHAPTGQAEKPISPRTDPPSVNSTQNGTNNPPTNIFTSDLVINPQVCSRFMRERHHRMLGNHVLEECNHVSRVCGVIDPKVIIINSILIDASALLWFLLWPWLET